ncbi:uncharacterized protein LOC141684204 isoform X2 [Apium graveolens]|uniref:uncharacterized protein LOC141684204 isoform X2 n=1 Tax=Apium graveolens TaxID=4045 RepID=UPI003D7AD785
MMRQTFSQAITLGRGIPIVHRVIKVHKRQDGGEEYVITKGDNNEKDDRILYPPGQLWLQRHHIMGRAVGFLPYVGWVTIIMTEKLIIKHLDLLFSSGQLFCSGKRPYRYHVQCLTLGVDSEYSMFLEALYDVEEQKLILWKSLSDNYVLGRTIYNICVNH